MAALTSTIYRLLIESSEPLSFREIKQHFEKSQWSAVGAQLYNMHLRGFIRRVGVPREYAYFITDETRARLADAGANDLRRNPRPPTTHIERRPPQCGMAQQPAWPAPDKNRDLSPSVGLPWSDEDDLPPVLGERCADVMHRIPLE